MELALLDAAAEGHEDLLKDGVGGEQLFGGEGVRGDEVAGDEVGEDEPGGSVSESAEMC